MRHIRSSEGFSILEVVVVLGVLGALASVLAPLVFRYIDDANIQRAHGDVAAMSTAINKMYKDTGRWPFYADGDGALAHTSGTDAVVLSSNATCSMGTCTDATLPVDGTSGSWGLGGVIDNIANQIITNTPMGSTDAEKNYNETGARAWQGPYVDRVPSTDAWGRSYVVNIVNANPAVAAASQKWVLVVSAGPDGTLSTSATAALNSNPIPGGDDIIARVR